MQVTGIWRYPVKSLQGEPLSAVAIESDGLRGDRRWGIRDDGTGRILTARRRPELLHAAAGYRDEEPVIALPDGRTTVGAGPETDRALSDWLRAPVSLVASVGADPGRAEFFEDATDDTSPAVEWTMPESRFVDAAALLVLTTASLRRAAALLPGSTWDVRRFRPNIVVDTPGDEWAEDEWIGRPLRIGSADLAPIEGCIRCTMVTREQPGIPDDRDVFRVLARHHGGRFGVWCDVTTAGEIAVGDAASVPVVEVPSAS